MNSQTKVRVADIYAGERVLITGGTGFLGKALIEKLLRSCPDIDHLYVLIRKKRDEELQVRMDKLLTSPVFNKIKLDNPGIIEKKITAIAGDVAELNLGLSKEDRKLLVENTTIVIHQAASVRFDQPLKEAILINTRGTRDMCKLTLEMKSVKIFVHISTAYCHTKYPIIEEKVYTPYADWKRCIKLAENIDNMQLNSIAPIFMDGFPNTYTFTKSMAENVVNDMLQGKVLNMILRPTIVVSAELEPMPGWTDNFNGPTGLFAAIGSGLIRVILASPNTVSDYIPVDKVIRSLLVIIWYNLRNRVSEKSNATLVYNLSSHDIFPVSVEKLRDIAYEMSWECPLSISVWHPSKLTTSSETKFFLYIFLFQLIPGLFIDCLFRLFNKKPLAVKIHRRYYNAMMCLKFFSNNHWIIPNLNTISLLSKIEEDDKMDFDFDIPTDFNVHKFFVQCGLGFKQYLLGDDLADLERDKIRFKVRYIVDLAVKYGSYGMLFYFLFVKLNVIQYSYEMLCKYWNSL